MDYEDMPDGGVEVGFQGIEVAAVRAAFIEHGAYLRSLGNDSSISRYQKQVMQWKGEAHTYRGPNPDPLVHKLRYFSETTEERVDEILDTHEGLDRLEASGRRYELGQEAARILDSVQLRSSMEAEWSDLLEES